jgi:hypothetical protein
VVTQRKEKKVGHGAGTPSNLLWLKRTTNSGLPSPASDLSKLIRGCLLLDAGTDLNIRGDTWDATGLVWAQSFGGANFAKLIGGRGGQP